MNLELALWAPWDASEKEARADVERQAMEWADAEPKVTACRIVKVHRPYSDRSTWWEVTVELDLIEQPENLTLFDEAAA